MAYYFQRIDRLRKIVALVVQKGRRATDTGFADFVLNMCASLGLSSGRAREYIETLVKAYRFDRWKSYLQNNNYIEKAEADQWLKENANTG